ncbi:MULTISPECIES: response regulator transcription factor [Actinomadura]|uniref:response regulator transcription factor n=1 Tax=Actinomadura TaxID=1988 RepID=UPI000417349D|nr:MULTISPECIES: response regulator transcription factor [Actinomadura]RSN69231.1 DNA-binding response regulator [Actinomadura sp. WAC 06369]
MIRVLLADDQHLFRGALAALLTLEDDLEVVAEAGTGDAVLPAVRDHRPDVALLDIEMPGRDGLALAADIARAYPGCRVVIVTTFGRPGYLQRALDGGATGFVVKDTPADRLAEVIRRVHAGDRVVDPKLASASVSLGRSPLTDRERDVLRAAADGSRVADVAARLHLAKGTVRNHLSSAILKTGAKTRSEAVRIAEDNGWL